MATFPKLKTSAVAQYPASKTIKYQNQALRFLDGTEQRYRDSAGPLHRWVLKFVDLDESEMASIAEFFSGDQGQFGSFAFTDPWDGTVYPDCSLASDELDQTWQGEMRGTTSLTVMENRG